MSQVPPEPSPPQESPVPAGWYFDPGQRYEHRFWDGAAWTDRVFKKGREAVDPLPPAQPSVVDQALPGTSGASTVSQHSEVGVPPAPPNAGREPTEIPFFGARKRAQELAEEVKGLRAELDRLNHLGVLSVGELEQRRSALTDELAGQAATLENERQQASAELERHRAEAEERLRKELAEATAERDALQRQLRDLHSQVVVTEDEALLQEAGVYKYRHPLDDSVAYQAELSRLRDLVKTMTRKDGGAVLATTTWTVNGSTRQGRTMVRDFSKLMLRAYNAEADNLVRGLKPYKLHSAIDRLTKVAATIARLGKTMDIRISDAFHELRVKELELTADYREKLAEEKEREREERQRLREERQAQQEMERERARLEKERQHHANALNALLATGDDEAASRLREQLTDIDQRIEDVDYRAANIRAGYVYVISNVGSLGEKVVKVGMTRRIDPLDRVRELGDASVPFKFDVHALFFSEDAVGIEAKLHERLADRRVNAVNRRREFFYATPQEVKECLVDLTGELLQFEELAEALEYRQSLTEARVSS